MFIVANAFLRKGCAALSINLGGAGDKSTYLGGDRYVCQARPQLPGRQISHWPPGGSSFVQWVKEGGVGNWASYLSPLHLGLGSRSPWD